MQALATLLAVFNPVCDLTEYERSYTNSSLPFAVPFDHMLTELLPANNAKQDFLRWYDVGMKECNAFLATNPFQGKQKMSPLFNTGNAGVATASSCRGNPMLYHHTGLLVWPFGPIKDCQTYSRCWFGLLTCGTFRRDDFHDTFGTTTDDFQGWSMRSLHIDMSVSGPEVVAPRVRYTSIPEGVRGSSSTGIPGNSSSNVSVLVADYMLTVDGEYSIDLGLMGLYPRVLSHSDASISTDTTSSSSHRQLDGRGERPGKKVKSKLPVSRPAHLSQRKSDRRENKPDKSTNKKMQEKLKNKFVFKPETKLSHPRSVELLNSVFLGGCERRPSGRSFCVPACQELSRVHGSPFFVHTKNLVPSARCGELSTWNAKPLPYCTRGNHPGRYLRIPSDLLQHCSAAEYGDKLVAERARQFGKRQWFDRYEAIENAYFRNAQSLDIAPIFTKLQANSSVHYAELLRYLNNENICMLVDIGRSKKVPTSKADIYAPYSCKYRVYDWQKAASCQLENKGMAIFHGDSMNRALFGRFSGIMGFEALSQSQLKNMTNNNNQNFIKVSNNKSMIAHYNTWDGSHDFLGGEAMDGMDLPGIYLANFALAHSLNVDLAGREEYFNEHSPTVQFWRDLVTKDRASGKIMNKNSQIFPRIAGIYQSASAMHGKRNTGFSWMEESLRRNNLEMRRLFIDQLGFLDFDEHLLTSANFQVTGDEDGWHYGGTPGINAVHILTNLICNIHISSLERG
mmetsp:Transcript_8285/g.14035  ORF Transcript_8285/g.14035 Transcript_8285/m.14035 type:complete len:737 (-) Transcript_8285:117-2327(-)|eukprot:CAMPEP_0114450806 /NCGR_PEP_ID=MMETSP0104-20121206/652_1 /TAXON_ID=37642 ORGANISM="Paraphysomonas imperforata, Strain PA2" /NCGR_SAMPLE_ID=MMETSP0104 /ASSEMBLY_ACC=CAM_ASM_000202 /LENGTH=736 /DNA_ID=CAMNT_0001622963 /DNA_START=26 /DNA_END=2236 /DNA_ORIENTATION=+